MTEFYPQSPEFDREDFTKISTNYQKNVFVVLVGIILFFLIYAAAVAGAVYLFYQALTYDMGRVNKLTLFLKIGSVGMAGMFALFMVKFLFKKQRLDDNPLHIEITETEHPNLFQFIKKLSQETNAPFPKKIYVNHEINAAVFYNSTILSLFLPTKKNLLIGLGLVNGLNLTEFKAVIAHEFGHFSQSSMRLGSYVYMTNRIIYDMVNERDYWDRALDSMKTSDIRVAIFAWLLMPAVWTTRQLMILIYKGINILQSSLSRQMEYHADLVAVSVTGSDAIINGLYKLEATSTAFNFASEHVYAAIQDKMYTSNLLYHHTKAAEYLEVNNQEYRDSLFKNLKGDRIFLEDDDTHMPNMYASHPSGYKREDNAKKNYIKGDTDERSPWILFSNKEALCEKVTKNLLKINFNLSEDTNFTPAIEVENFIVAEIEETQFSPEYYGTYDTRYLSEFSLQNLDAILSEFGITKSNNKEGLDSLYASELKEKAEKEKVLNEEFVLLTKVLNNQVKGKEFDFRGTIVAKKEAEKIYKQLIEEADQDDWYAGFDKKVFTHIYHLCTENEREELLQRYQFQFDFQKCHRVFTEIQHRFLTKIDEINNLGSLEENEVRDFARTFNTLRNQFHQNLKDVDNLILPPMNNTQHIASLKEHLLEEEVAFVSSANLDGEKLNKLLIQVETVVTKSKRIHFKGMGNILKLHESIRKATN